MAANEQVFDTIVDPIANKQLKDLTADLILLDEQAVDTVKSINLLNSATANSKTFSDYNKKVAESAILNEKLTQVQNKTAQSVIQLQKAQIQLEAATKRQNDSLQKALSPYEKLSKQLIALRNNAKDVAVQFGITSDEFKAASVPVQELDAKLKGIDQSLGQSQRNVGGYANGITQALGKTFGVIRQLAYILPGIGIAGILNLAIEPLTKYVQGLDLFSVALDNLKLKAQAVQAALSSSEYTNALESVTKLGVDLDLAKQGFVDKDHVIDEYNKSIGAVTGRVDTLDEAEKGLTKNANSFIQATLLKAAAQNVLAEAAKNAVDTAKENADQQAEIEYLSKNGTDFGKAFGIDVANQAIGKNNVELKKKTDISVNIIRQFQKQIADINRANGQSEGGITDIATLQNKIDNQSLEMQKESAQALIGNDKLSYSTRLKANQDFAKNSREIELNNMKLSLSDTKLSTDEKLAITNEATLKIQQISQSEIDKRRELLNKLSAQEIEHLKNTLQAQKDADKLIVDNTSATFDARIAANDDYKDKSISIVEATYKEEKKNAGENSQALILAKDHEKKALLDIDLEYQQNAQKIQHDAIQALKDLLKLEAGFEDQIINDLKNNSAERISGIETSRLEAEKSLSEQYAKGLVTQKDYQNQIKAIDNKAASDRLDTEIKTAESILAVRQGLLTLGVGGVKDVQAAKDSLAGLKNQKVSVDIKTNNDTAQSKRDDRIKEAQDISSAIGYAQQLQEDGQKLLNDAYQQQIDLLQQKSQLITDNAKKETDAINNSFLSTKDKQDQINIVNAKSAIEQNKIAQEEQKLKEKNAEFNKAIAIAQIIENTAIAISKTIAEGGVLFGVPLVPIVATLGALQLATVLAQPIPKYNFRGTDNFEGGLTHVGERGTELITLPSGKSFLSPNSDTLMYLPQHTKILEHNKTVGFGIRPDPIKNSGEQIGWGHVLKQLQKMDKPQQKNKSVIRINVDTGFDKYKRSYFK